MEVASLYEEWSKRNPYWEKRYEESVIKKFTDYGKGESSFREDRGKLFGPGYEIVIIAFFIGLYYDKRKKLIADSTKRKSLGQPIQYWGNITPVKFRTTYPKIRDYIFMALIARTDIDFIALDKGEIKLSTVVDMLMTTMNEYINCGLDYIEDKVLSDSNYFFSPTAFLDVFLGFDSDETEAEDDDEPEEL